MGVKINLNTFLNKSPRIRSVNSSSNPKFTRALVSNVLFRQCFDCLHVFNAHVFLFVSSKQFNKLKFDYLLFDLNHLVYLILQNEEVREQVDADPQMLDLFYERFFKYIRCVIELIQPSKLIYFAFDGVSPKAKHRVFNNLVSL